MFAITVFGYLFGFVWLLIAVPFAAAIGVVIRFAMQRHLSLRPSWRRRPRRKRSLPRARIG